LRSSRAECEDGSMETGEPADTWWVYMVSCRGGKIYTGTARDPQARFRAHCAGRGAAFTRANPPVEMLRCEPFESRQTACRVEAALKKLPRRTKLTWARGGELPFSLEVAMARVPVVVKEECISCGACVDACPGVFRLDEENRAEAYDPQGAGEAAIQEAMDLCPVTCIHWEEKG
jgi:predicted GIY-YIG superfamily endonuclease/ferredoxin